MKEKKESLHKCKCIVNSQVSLNGIGILYAYVN